ncbi:MAG: hypothetical protein M3N47_05010 [Chloroflexota bacterium]|nr:hypothetical protein [Chloroflexota bacterium]
MSAGSTGFAWNLALSGLVVGVLSLLTYRLVELPALRRNHARTAAEAPMAAAQLEAAP